MKSVSVVCLLVFAWTVAACDVVVRTEKIGQVREIEVLFSKQSNNSLDLCFELKAPRTEQVYLLRLDYLPFQCLNTKNDAKFNWNEQKQLYSIEQTFTRQCKKRTLHKDEEQPYRIIYEARQGYDKGGILAHNQLVHKYLPTVAVLFVVSVVAERLVFASMQGGKDKRL